MDRGRPGRASYQVAVNNAQDLVTTARNITDPDSELVGNVGCAVLAASTRPAGHERVTRRRPKPRQAREGLS